MTGSQKIVLNWLKNSYTQAYGAAIIRTIHLLQRENERADGDLALVAAYRSMDTAQEAYVVNAFVHWAMEQEDAE